LPGSLVVDDERKIPDGALVINREVRVVDGTAVAVTRSEFDRYDR